jgi:transcriptional regulator with XRE-family HTH domain
MRHDPVYIDLIDKLRQRRRELGLSQAQVAACLNVSKSWLSKTELRERRLDILDLYRLCEVYDMSWTEIGSILEGRP